MSEFNKEYMINNKFSSVILSKTFKRSVEDKDCGPVVKTTITRCIHCTRCVRFSTEVAGNELIGAFGRGEEIEIGTYIQSFIKTELSGNFVDLCPVGALTSKPYAFRARNWELQQVDSVDFFDTLTSDIVVHSRNSTKVISTPSKSSSNNPLSVNVIGNEKIFRILPGINTKFINWISDRTRYAFDGLNRNRLLHPIVISDNIDTNSDFGHKKSHWKAIIQKKLIAFDTAKAKPIIFIMGSLSNLEMVYAVNTFIKTLGYSAIALSAYTPKLQLDIPFFFRINMTLRSFVITEIAGLLIVGTNLRYEASLLNTSLRREQNTGGFVFSTIGAFSPQAYNHTHQGNSMRTVFNYVENRVGFVKSFINSNLPFGILLSVNALRNNYAYFIQKIIYSLGKLFFIKTNKKDRIGFIHSNVGSLAFSHLGVYSKNTSFDSFAEKEYSLFIAGQNSNKLNWSSLNKIRITSNTFFDTNFEYSQQKLNIQTKAIPMSSLYEREGLLFSLQGIVRKHNKVVSVPASSINSLESILSLIMAQQINSTLWANWITGLSKFNSEVPLMLKLDQTADSFIFNPFLTNVFVSNSGKLTLFSQPIHDFYLQEPIAEHSVTMSECALFLSQKSNFIQGI